MDMYVTGFAGWNLVEPRFMNIEFFRTNGFQFQELLEYQGLKDFISIKCEYLIELVKVFYCNLAISNGNLCFEVKRLKIRVKPADWLKIVGLKFQGEKLEVGNIRAWESYDRDEAVKGMIRVGLQQPSKVNKVKARKITDLPYAMLITKLLEHYGVDTAKEGVIEQRDHAEVEPKSPIAGITNVAHVQSVDDNMHRILTAIEDLHDTMIEHHNKVEKKIEEMVNRIQCIEDRLPPPNLG
ncbi:hypothetical protein SESBI_19783 [Sesbania bispinosa]|nr:hypothetical protein SESBI_19783 [Sesbania bispinosa]